MKFDMIISDFDGTLGSWPETISVENVKAIKEYQKKGGIFVLCTGRMYQSAIEIYKKNGMTGTISAYQGAVIEDLMKGERIYDNGMTAEEAVMVVSDLKGAGLKVVADINDVMYCEQPTWYSERHKAFAPVVQVEKLEDVIKEKNQKVYKVVAADEPDVIAKNTVKFSEKYKGKLLCNNGSDRLLEVVSPCCGKGNVVRFLSSYYKIPFERIMTIGDSTNDEMLVKGEWYGVCVGDGVEMLKKCAKEVTVPFSQNPVKTLIEKYCL